MEKTHEHTYCSSMVEHLKFKKHELECFHADNSRFVGSTRTQTDSTRTQTGRLC